MLDNSSSFVYGGGGGGGQIKLTGVVGIDTPGSLFLVDKDFFGPCLVG